MSISLNVVSMAYVFCALLRRSETRLRRRVIFTRLSVRFPAGVAAGAGAAAALGAAAVGAAGAAAALGAAAGAGAGAALAASPAVPGTKTAMCCPTVTVSPSATSFQGQSHSHAFLTHSRSFITLTLELAQWHQLPVVSQSLVGGIIIRSPSDSQLAREGKEWKMMTSAKRVPLSLSFSLIASLSRTSPHALYDLTTPAEGARTSMVTLSVSICAMVSSVATLSPGCLMMAAMAPSVMESPAS
jgi:hypothetical protein